MDIPEPTAPDRTGLDATAGPDRTGLDPPAAPDEIAAPICSAKGCRRPAQWALRWNNPKLHTAHRRKTWLACDDHRAHLAGFLTARGFLREIDPMP